FAAREGFRGHGWPLGAGIVAANKLCVAKYRSLGNLCQAGSSSPTTPASPFGEREFPVPLVIHPCQHLSISATPTDRLESPGNPGVPRGVDQGFLATATVSDVLCPSAPGWPKCRCLAEVHGRDRPARLFGRGSRGDRRREHATGHRRR